MAWYDTGTVSVTNGSTTVTGSGTNFIAGAQVGEAFYGPDDSLYEIISITSATALVLADAYLGSTQTGQEYKIVPTQSLVADLTTQVSSLISDFQSVKDEAGEGKFDDGTAASAGITFNLDQDTGFFRPAANQIGFATAGVQRALLTSTGLNSTVIGATTPAAGSFTTVTFGDNDKAIFGAGSDLQIYHDGFHSNIKETGAGSLLIDGDNIYFRNGAGTENYADFVADGAVTLRHNNLPKLATTATGIDVTGTVTADGVAIDGDSITANAQNAMTFEFAAATGIISADRTGGNFANLSLRTTAGSTPLERLKISYDGDISFYEDTGTTPKFFWDASAESLGIGTTSPDSLAGLEVYGKRLYVDAGDDFALRLEKNSVVGGYIGAPALSNLAFYSSGGAERMRIDSSGNVGIGTSSPSALTHLSKSEITAYNGSATDGQLGVGSTMFIQQTGPNNNAIAQLVFQPRSGYGYNRIVSSGGSAPYMTFATNNSEAMRIDSSGNLLVGKTGTSLADAGIVAYGGSGAGVIGMTSATRPLYINKLTSDGDIIELAKDGSTVGSIGAANGSFTFSTNSEERVNISATGNVGIGTSTDSGNATTNAAGHFIRPASTASFANNNSLAVILNRTGTDGAVMQFRKAASGTGSISVTATTTSFNTSSDYRLKEDVQPMVGASDRVLSLKPCNFAWKVDGSRVDGFLAHEAQAVVPEAVTGEKDGEEMQAIDQSKLVPLLTAALQEALTKIDALETRIATLEG